MRHLQNIHTKEFWAMYLAICTLVVCLMFASSEAGAVGLRPLRTEVNIRPGEARPLQFSIINDSDKPTKVDLSAEVFSVVNEQYDYAFDGAPESTKWVNFQQTHVVLEPGEERGVSYTLGIPHDAEPGGRYLSIFASESSEDDSTKLSIKKRIGSLLYINVEGDVTRAGELKSLSVAGISVSGQETATFLLRNSGTTHYRSKYSWKVENLVGGSESKGEGDALILPASIRRVSEDIQMPTWPGVYRAVFTIGLGDNPAVTETRYIIYIPTWSLIGVIGIVIALVSVRRFRRISASRSVGSQYTK